MSTPNEKTKNTTRRYRDELAIQRQVKIAKSNNYGHYDKIIKEPHRLAKHHATNCSTPGCVMCANPRKTFKELTQQEKSFYQDLDSFRDTRSNGLTPRDED